LILKNKSIKTFSIIAAICIGSLLGGCGKTQDPELEAYKASMTEFYDKLTEYDGSMNAIDPASETAKTQLLDILDQMNESYKVMAAAPVPDQFSGIADISVEAADYMQKADEFYHMAYDNDFDASSEMLAAQYYQRANNRVLVMLQVLHGEVPEGEGISVETQSTYEISTIDDSSTDGE
jgi:hypothetical protein